MSIDNRISTAPPILVVLPPRPSNAALALRDLTEGTTRWWMWSAMAWQDILQRYRGSVLGPFWLTLSMMTMIGALGFLYAQLLRVEINDYLPFLCVGLIVWTLISTIILEGCMTFISAEHMIRQIKLPFSVLAWRVVYRNLIIAAHNIVVFFGVAVIFKMNISPIWFISLIGLAFIVFNGFWVSMVFGMICARFRDVPQIVGSLIQITFFVTPILWQPQLLEGRIAFAQWNPLYGFIDLVRAPLLNEFPGWTSWACVSAVSLVGGVSAFFFFARLRSRISYWA